MVPVYRDVTQLKREPNVRTRKGEPSLQPYHHGNATTHNHPNVFIFALAVIQFLLKFQLYSVTDKNITNIILTYF